MNSGWRRAQPDCRSGEFKSVSFKSAIRNPHPHLKPVVFLASLGPFAWLVWAALTGNLSANPLSDLTNETGVWTLRFLCITLAITPLRRLTGWNAAIRFRRMTGLFAFFYGTLHFLIYVIADRFAGLDFTDGMSRGRRRQPGRVGRRGHLQAAVHHRRLHRADDDGAAGATSTAGMIRRLGGRRWNRLHRLVYLTGIAGVLHYWWLVKADVRRPQAYALVVGLLLAFRALVVGPEARRLAGPRARAFEELILLRES